MTNEEILKAAIEKAEKNTDEFLFVSKEDIEKINRIHVIDGNICIFDKNETLIYMIKPDSITGFLFSEYFAKAFWGEKEMRIVGCWDCSNDEEGFDMVVAWKYHLQKMVLEEDPVKYLEQFLK